MEALVKHPYSVTHWGSHPDEDNDDCWTGSDHATKEAAMDEAENGFIYDHVAFIMIDGPDIHEVRPNPCYSPRNIHKEDASDRSERAMQAGMAFGCQGYNEEMGYD